MPAAGRARPDRADHLPDLVDSAPHAPPDALGFVWTKERLDVFRRCFLALNFPISLQVDRRALPCQVEAKIELPEPVSGVLLSGHMQVDRDKKPRAALHVQRTATRNPLVPFWIRLEGERPRDGPPSAESVLVRHTLLMVDHLFALGNFVVGGNNRVVLRHLAMLLTKDVFSLSLSRHELVRTGLGEGLVDELGEGLGEGPGPRGPVDELGRT